MSTRRIHPGWQVALAATLLVGLVGVRASAQSTFRASVDAAGMEADLGSQRPCLNRDGSAVAFESDATNLVLADGNGVTDVFLRQLSSGAIDRVSVNNLGVEGDGPSFDAHLASTAAIVAFSSDATNLVVNDTNGFTDVFARDVAGGVTVLVSRGVGGNPANGPSREPYITANGRFVIFTSDASNLVPGDGNGQTDVFVFDFAAGVTDCVSVDGFGVIGANGPSYQPSLSSNGQFAAFASDAANLVAGDGNAATDVFVRSLVFGVTLRINLGPGPVEANGASAHPVISEDGLFVAYDSAADNLVAGDVNGAQDVFRFDRTAVATELVSVATGGAQADFKSSTPAIASTGSFVAFLSSASNLSPQDLNGVQDVYVRDFGLGVTHRASVTHYLLESAVASEDASIAGDGVLVAWGSSGDAFVPNDLNVAADVFARKQTAADTQLYGSGHAGTLGVPPIALLSDPVMGLAVTLDVQNSSGVPTLGVLLLGFTSTAAPAGWGGDILVIPSFVTLLPLPVAGAQLSATLGHDETLEATSVYLQALELDPGASSGISSTRGLQMTLGW